MNTSGSSHALQFLAALLLLSACKGGQESGSEESAVTDEVVGSAPDEMRGFPSVVLLRPLEEHAGLSHPVESDTLVMDQYGMQFLPEVVVARPGQPVAFTNSDDTPHIVTVRAEGGTSALLDEATDVGTRLDLTFDEPGTYDVSCSLHPGMAGIVLVSEAAYTALAERGGTWRIPGVPPGRYRIEVWSADVESRWQDTIHVGVGTTVVPDRIPRGGQR